VNVPSPRVRTVGTCPIAVIGDRYLSFGCRLPRSAPPATLPPWLTTTPDSTPSSRCLRSPAWLRSTTKWTANPGAAWSYSPRSFGRLRIRALVRYNKRPAPRGTGLARVPVCALFGVAAVRAGVAHRLGAVLIPDLGAGHVEAADDGERRGAMATDTRAGPPGEGTGLRLPGRCEDVSRLARLAPVRMRRD
jgi:hypothetical protein